MYYGVAILRVPQGLDYSQVVEDEDTPVVMNGNETTGAAVAEEIKRNQSAGQLSQGKVALHVGIYRSCLYDVHEGKGFT